LRAMGGCRAYNKGSVEISGTVLEKPAKKGESPVCENDCLKYKLELIFFGENKKVVKAVDEYQRGLEEIIDEIEDYEHFVNSEIMMEYLNILHDLAENNEIYCACGSTDVELRLLSDKIEIQCKSCENILSLPANSHNDLEEFKKVDHIFIEKKIFL
jgi:hypothetical protein